MKSSPAHILMALSLGALPTWLVAQYNSKGTFHASIGTAIGAHGIAYDETIKLNEFGLPFEYSQSSTGGAATTTVPIELGVGLGRVFSLGVFVEPGAYVDSSGSNASNAIVLVGLQPRFYLVNRDRFAWMASLQVGASGLRIQRKIDDVAEDAGFSGGIFGLGTGVGVKLADVVGLQFHLRYLGSVMDLRARELDGISTMDIYTSRIGSAGVLAQLGLAFHIGGVK